MQFNIFYPDLIDKSKAPTYKIVKEPGNEETVLLHFTAGPPYEDIAFRIVNREWEYSHKRLVTHILPELDFDVSQKIYRGFRSSFDRGCLSLWFNFRRNVSLCSFTACLDNVFDGVTVLPQIAIHIILQVRPVFSCRPRYRRCLYQPSFWKCDF